MTDPGIDQEPRDPESIVLNLVFLGPPLVFAAIVLALGLRHEALAFNPLSVALVGAFVLMLLAFPLLRHGFRE